MNPGSRVIDAGGVANECVNTVGRVLVAGGVAIERFPVAVLK